MGTRYPDQVGGHNPVCPLLRLLVPVPVRDVLATTVVVVSLVDTGPPGLAQLGVGRSGQESVMAMEWFRRNVVGPPEWEYEAMGSVVWVQCATAAECINLSIAESTVTDMLESRSHHGSTFK